MSCTPVRASMTRSAMLSLVLAGVSLTAWAQHSVSVPVEIEHSTNPALAVDGSPSVTRYRVSPQYTIENQNGPTQTRFSFGGVIERSSNTDVSDHRADPNLSLGIEQATPTGGLGLRLSFSQASTREVEFAETGVVAVDATQRDIELTGSWTREISDVSRFELGLGFARVSYDTPLYIGSREWTGSVGVSHDLAEDTQAVVRLIAARLDPDQGLPGSSRRGVAVGATTRLSESLGFSGEVGVARTTGLVSRSSPTAAVRLDYEGERLTSALELSRSPTVSGITGAYSVTRVVSWTADYPLSERTSVNVSAIQARSRGDTAVVGTAVWLGARHSISEFWTMEGRLGQLRSRPEAGGSARSSVLALMLTYMHPDF